MGPARRWGLQLWRAVARNSTATSAFLYGGELEYRKSILYGLGGCGTGGGVELVQ